MLKKVLEREHLKRTTFLCVSTNKNKKDYKAELCDHGGGIHAVKIYAPSRVWQPRTSVCEATCEPARVSLGTGDTTGSHL